MSSLSVHIDRYYILQSLQWNQNTRRIYQYAWIINLCILWSFYFYSRIYKAGPEDNFAEDLRYLRGFLPMEDMIEKAFIKLQSGENSVYPKVDIKQMPYPCYEKDE